MLVKFSTLAGGVWIEQRDEIEYSNSTRCFRFDAQGRAEWAPYGELASVGTRARWYGFWAHANNFEFA